MDATQALLIVIITFAVRDGLLGWALIRWVIRVSTPVPGTPPDPGTPPVIVTPHLPPTPPSPRFTGITATSFGGAGDSNASAYGGMVDPDKPGAALPYRFSGGPPTVRAFHNGKTVDCPVVDVGPWNINDPYWTSGSRPEAESGTDNSGRKTNLAGLDLTPAAWTALGVSNPNSVKAQVDWDFVSVLDAKATTPTTGPAPTGGTPSWLTLARSLVGVNENDDPSRIVGWSKAIAAKFPDMASYSAQYTNAGIPWCGHFVAYVLSQSGIRPPFGTTDTDKYLWAPSFDDWGIEVTGDPQPGDILRFKWSGGGEHVSIYDHEVDDNYYHCTGGNQGNPGQVSTEAMPMSACVAIRRPPSA